MEEGWSEKGRKGKRYRPGERRTRKVKTMGRDRPMERRGLCRRVHFRTCPGDRTHFSRLVSVVPDESSIGTFSSRRRFPIPIEQVPGWVRPTSGHDSSRPRLDRESFRSNSPGLTQTEEVESGGRIGLRETHGLSGRLHGPSVRETILVYRTTQGPSSSVTHP